MNSKLNFLKYQKWRWLLAIGLGILAILILYLLTGNEFATAVLWIGIVLALLILGNMQIHKKLDQFHPWTKFPLRRFIAQFALSAIYSLTCINLCYYFLKTLFIGLPPDWEQVMVLNIYGLLFFIPVMSINFGIFFMQRWKKAVVKSEKLQAENLKSTLESLKTHIDPHFLFNNLNVLSSLMDKDISDAQRFLGKFADVYRYVLQHRNEELVELETELAFIRSYIYLFQQRLNRQLKITIDVSPLRKTYYLPPLSVQMLVENAIKHNVATVSKPLYIDIFLETETYIVVKNAYQPKDPGFAELPKTGLMNIQKRFAYFSNQEIQINKSDTEFVVKLPLLELENESGNN
ncbi:histidine kinase [Echinicola sp. CAU 1574]|uniref:Histidine kinase n=1 Tax=Echinicola arenosa TaxID=2774144 RepID=A0ABR9ATT9_9BACT|nr:histidine kinase [Echinicola arenosa]MBD8491315.1 histidine kinase [Echinicola arenosa]